MDRLWQKPCAVIAVFVLAMGLFAHAAPTMAMSGTMAGTMAMAQTSFGHDEEADCAAHDMSSAVCHAVCAAATAVLTGTTWIHAYPGLDLNSCTLHVYLGHDSRPDPAPPKPVMVI